MIKKFNYHLSRFLIKSYEVLGLSDGRIMGKRYRQHKDYVQDYEGEQ